MDDTYPLTVNIGIASPLLSRFDLVLLLKDRVDKEWDELVADYILEGKGLGPIQTDDDDGSCWNIQTLQV